MDLTIQKSEILSNLSLEISGSKSETNRLLILQALFPNISLRNISDSDDSRVMINALASTEESIDVHHAGTAMRFLTAYFVTLPGRTVTLTGSDRMKERPIKELVAALRQMGGDIEYLENDGFPPIKIRGKKIVDSEVSINADVSSQFITALLLIAPSLENGIRLTLNGTITSMPYIQMTLKLLKQIGIKASFVENLITVLPTPNTQHPTPNTQHPTPITIESDWSSASYFYSTIALSSIGTTITLSTYKSDSLQGDRALVEIYKDFAVATTFNDDSITLTKVSSLPTPNTQRPTPINLHLNNIPDLAQTIAVTCFGLGLACHLTGLQTLKIKETDRLQALKNELAKLGANVQITSDSLELSPSETITPNVTIATYNDHRMAMAFAPLALIVPITIENGEVVSKSYPDFWNDLSTIGFNVSEID